MIFFGKWFFLTYLIINHFLESLESYLESYFESYLLESYLFKNLTVGTAPELLT